MTQILIPSTDLLRTPQARHAVDQLMDALVAAESIPTEDFGLSPITGHRYARYGAVIRIEHERFPDDSRGPAWDKRWATHTTPADADAVLIRMLHEGREVYTVTAIRWQLGGTTTR